MEEKKSCRRLLGCLLLCMVCSAGFIVVTDPFYHYHKPWFGMPVVLENAVYQTAGAASNLEYDSAIVGTSMTENFHTDWFDDELGWHTMKLSYSGARSSDLNAIFRQIFKKGREPAHIFMDINAYQLTSESWTAYVERPEYLYDDNPFNDYRYVYNHDVFVMGLKRVLDAAEGIGDNVDSAYTWEQEELFGREIALAASRDTREGILGRKGDEESGVLQASVTGDTLRKKLSTCRENLENILPFIREHQNTEFIIIIPPYSMLYWEQEVLKGDLEDTVRIYTYAIEQFLQYENVVLYYFQDAEDIIYNLDNYRDNAHHRPQYNRYIFECIKSGENRITLDSYQERVDHMYRIAKDYEYEKLWGE